MNKLRYAFFAACAALAVWSVVEAPWDAAQYYGPKAIPLYSVQRGPVWNPPQMERQSQSPRLMLEILLAQWATLAIVCFTTHRLLHKKPTPPAHETPTA